MFFKTKKMVVLYVLCFVCILFNDCSTKREIALPDKIKALMDTYHSIGQFNGSVIVSKGENIIYKDGFGLANKEWNILNDTETKFRIGSITKQFTAAVILRLVDEGKLKLNQKVYEILPEFREDIGKKVSIHQLLCHTSGISLPDFSIEEYDSIFQKKLSTKQILDLCSQDLAFEPGSKFRYSSAGYMVLGAIIEKITKKSYEEVLKEKILTPLNMKNTGIDDYERILLKRASGYQTNYGIGNAKFKYMPSSFSSGSMYSTVVDMNKWFVGLCSNKILSKESTDLIFAEQTTSHRGYYGYGWFISDREYNDSTIQLVFHAGDVNGFSAIIMGNPVSQELVVLLTNQEGTHYYDIAENIFRVLNNTQIETPKKYLADILREAVYSNIESIANIYERFMKEGIQNYNTDEDEMIELGYDLLYVNKISQAIEIFKITTKLYPNSYNAFDSLGEAYYTNKIYDLAIKSYVKSLELNPENKNAIRMIQLIKNN